MEKGWFNIVIIIDGANGVGKTTILNQLSTRVPNVEIYDDEDLKEIFNQCHDYIRAREILQSKFKDDDTIYIVARWFASIYVFDYYNNYSEMKLNIANLVLPDYSCIITANSKNIIDRLAMRNNFEISMNLEEQLMKYEEASKLLKYDMYINNDEHDLNNIINNILDKVMILN